MINEIFVNNFKSLRNIDVRLSRVNILTGVNGRGKSSLLQTVLLLSQSLRKGENRLLLPNGDLKNLGSYINIHNVFHREEPLSIRFHSDKEDEKVFDLQYEQDTEKKSLGSLSSFSVNGVNMVLVGDDTMGGYNENGNGTSEELDENVTLSNVSDYASLNQLKKVLYVSADRVSARYREDINEVNTDLCPDGSNVLNVLSQQGEDVIKNVEKRMSEVFEGGRLHIEKNEKEIIMTLNSFNDSQRYSPINVGYGFGYLLFLITASVIAKENDILIIENPEAHLHPSAQSRIMRMLIRDAVTMKYQLFVETHSDHVVNTSLLEVKRTESPCKLDDMEIIFFSTGQDENGNMESRAQNLHVTNKGRIINPPRQFCDQYALDIREIYG